MYTFTDESQTETQTYTVKDVIGIDIGTTPR